MISFFKNKTKSNLSPFLQSDASWLNKKKKTRELKVKKKKGLSKEAFLGEKSGYFDQQIFREVDIEEDSHSKSYWFSKIVFSFKAFSDFFLVFYFRKTLLDKNLFEQKKVWNKFIWLNIFVGSFLVFFLRFKILRMEISFLVQIFCRDSHSLLQSVDF